MQNNDFKQKFYAVKNKDAEVVKSSRSGGFFTALSDYFLSNNGIIYGCIIDKNLDIVHDRAYDSTLRNKMRGSKYVQSNIKDTFKKIKNDLDNQLKVLFTGTPCQCAALYNYLGDHNPDLVVMDIVCHGVPSPKIWKDYVLFLSKKYGKLSNVDFRNKLSYGWRDHVETLYFENGKIIDSRHYTNLFCSHLTLRPSCYNCPYKNLHRHSDITIGDFWGIERISTEFNDNKGTSLVIINTKKGEKYFNIISKNLLYLETEKDYSLQEPLLNNFPVPRNRKCFWKDYSIMEFKDIISKYSDFNTVKKIKNYLLKIRYKITKEGLI